MRLKVLSNKIKRKKSFSQAFDQCCFGVTTFMFSRNGNTDIQTLIRHINTIKKIQTSDRKVLIPNKLFASIPNLLVPQPLSNAA